jgi:nicotinamide-nucleotide amidase
MKFVAFEIFKKLKNKKLNISVAESCTGGLLSSVLTSINGASKIFTLGLVTYSNQSKIKILKVPKKIIDKFGAVSKQCCLSMAGNLSKISKSDICISVTGIAGPSGGSSKKPVGLVFIGIKKDNKISVNKYLFKNKNRSFIQKAAVQKSLKLILSSLK